MSKTKVCIIHGWGASPESNWFPWLKGQLEPEGIQVLVPQMPNTEKPKLSEWLEHMKKLLPAPDENTILIGHSLGVISILRFLESLPEGTRIAQAILVSGFAEDLDYKELKSFVETPLQFEKIRGKAKKFLVIHGDDDPLVPLKQAQILRDELHAELVVIGGGKHLNYGSGYLSFPEVLEAILKGRAKI